jgi:AcrR family transcriptional regulator
MSKERLLEEALRLFALKSYEAVGVQEIVVAAGVTKPSLYHHFGSKRGLLDALLERHYSALFALLSQAVRYDGELPLSLVRTAQCFFDTAQKSPAFYRMQLGMWYSGLENESRQAVSSHFQRQHQIIESLFLDAAKDHGNLRGQHTAYSITFLGMINSHIAAANPGVTEELTRKAVKQFLYGIYAL